MTLEQCLKAAKNIDDKYLRQFIPPQRSDEGTELAHLRWMVQEMHNGMSNNKAMRWLGYIQGVLVALYKVPLEEMKNMSRAAVAE